MVEQFRNLGSLALRKTLQRFRDGNQFCFANDDFQFLVT